MVGTKLHWDIVNNKITTNANWLISEKNKTKYMESFLNDLGVDSKNYQELDERKKNLFKFSYRNREIKVYIEICDGGGKDDHPNGAKKIISIPFSNETFCRCLSNYDNVAVIGIYYPFVYNEQTKKNEPKIDDCVYFFLKPSNLYLTKGLDQLFENRQQKINPSSRWTTLTTIRDVILNRSINENAKHNVWIVHKSQLVAFWNTRFLPGYTENLDQLLKTLGEKLLVEPNNLKEKTNANIRKFRQCFRANLLNCMDHHCQIFNCPVTLVVDLIASHIRPINDIQKNNMSLAEKERQITDKNNGLLLCRNHDSLFDKFYITFDDCGNLIASDDIKKYLHEFGLDEQKQYIEVRDENKPYLKRHRELFRHISFKHLNAKISGT